MIFGPLNFLLRFLAAIVLVHLTYNPEGYSLYHWYAGVLPDFSEITPLMAVSAILLVIGWAIYLRAAIRSLGFIGSLLAVAFFGALFWLLLDIGWVNPGRPVVMEYVALIFIAALLAVGLSWSHIRRRFSGQLDVDDVEPG
jgi:hypothetical protein